MGHEDLGSMPSSSTSFNAAAEVHGDGGMTIEKCQEIIQKNLSNLSDPKVKILVENLEKSGCKLRNNFVRAINCQEKNLGGLHYRGKEIVICSNNKKSEEKVVTTLTHELIHAYDYCRGNLRGNCTADRACTEIRAYGLCGQCHIMKERGFPLRYLGFNRKEEVDQECVKRGAIWSLKFVGYSADEAKSAVEANWSRCYGDTAPFGPKLRHSFEDFWSRVENEDFFCCNLFV